MCTKRNFYLGKENNYQFFRDNSINVKSFSSKKVLRNKNLEKISTKSSVLSKRKSLFADKAITDCRKSPILKASRKIFEVANFSFLKNNENEEQKSVNYSVKENENFNYENDNKVSQKNYNFQFNNNNNNEKQIDEKKSEKKEKKEKK